MTTFDDDFLSVLSEEDLHNIENDNEGDEYVDESSSNKEQMKKILQIGKKEVDDLNERKRVEPLSPKNATICSLLKHLHDNYEN